MPDIHIERNHTLGMAGARKAARQWVEQLKQDYEIDCDYAESKGCDTGQFSRAGIDGSIEVTPDTLTIDVTLGFLFSAFSDQIERKITQNLDAVLGTAPPTAEYDDDGAYGKW